MAGINDLLCEVGINGSITSLSAPGKAVGATSINVGSTANWPAAGKTVFFAIRTVNPSAVTTTNTSGLVANSYSEWKGIVGTNAITSLTLQLGSVDQVYTAGANTQVLIPVTAPRENALVAWGQKSHDNLGNLLPNIVTAANIANTTITNAQIAPGGINYANLLTTIFSGQLQTYTDATGTGTFASYINLGGLKLFWGLTGATSTNPTGAATITFPGSFWTSAPNFLGSPLVYKPGVSGQVSVYTTLDPTTTSASLTFICASTSATAQFAFAFIGK